MHSSDGAKRPVAWNSLTIDHVNEHSRPQKYFRTSPDDRSKFDIGSIQAIREVDIEDCQLRHEIVHCTLIDTGEEGCPCRCRLPRRLAYVVHIHLLRSSPRMQQRIQRVDPSVLLHIRLPRCR